MVTKYKPYVELFPKLSLSLDDAQTIAAPWFLITKFGLSLVYAHMKDET